MLFAVLPFGILCPVLLCNHCVNQLKNEHGQNRVVHCRLGGFGRAGEEIGVQCSCDQHCFSYDEHLVFKNGI